MNCIIVDDDKLSRVVLERFISNAEELKLIASFPDAISAANSIHKNTTRIDLIFLDIEMPGMTGIDFMNSMNDLPQVIISSSKERYAIEAFGFDVTDYLLKPTSLPRFMKAVNKALKAHSLNRIGLKNKNEIFIKKGSSLIKIKFSDILWVEALENYVVLNSPNEKHTIHFTMKAIEQKLPRPNFVRVHRSFIVNTSNISVIKDNTIEIAFNDEVQSIPIGKSYKDKLLSDINLIVK